MQIMISGSGKDPKTGFGVLFSAPPQNLKSLFALLFAMRFMVCCAVLGSSSEPGIMICIAICNAFHVFGCRSWLLPRTWNHDLHCYSQCISCSGVLLLAPPFQSLKSWFALLFAMHFMFWGAVLGAWTWNHDLHCILQCISCFGVLFWSPPQNLKTWFALLFAMHFMFWVAVLGSSPEPEIMICIIICNAFHVLGCCSRLLPRSWNHGLQC